MIRLIRPWLVITFHLRNEESRRRDSRERNFARAGWESEL
jgi:hypothetical protein